MKSKNTVLAFLSFIFLLPVEAQKTTIKEISGTPFEGRNRGVGWTNSFKGGFMYDNTNYAVSVEYNAKFFNMLGFYVTEIYTSNLRLYKLDEKMNVDEVKVIDLMPGKHMVDFHSYKLVGESLFIFFEYKNKKDKKHYFFCKKYGLNDHEEQIFKVAERPYNQKGEDIQFVVNVSSDRKKLAIITNYLKKEKKKTSTSSGTKKKKTKNTTTFDYVVLDEDMSVLSSGAKIKLEANESESVWEYDITPNGKLLVVSSEVIDFTETTSKSKTGKTKLVLSSKTKNAREARTKFARRYYLNLYDDEEVTRIPVDEEKYQRGFYALPQSDSTILIYSYYTQNGVYTDGLMNSTLNLNTKSLENSDMASFAQVKGAGGEALDNEEVNDEEKPVKKTRKPAKKTKTSNVSKFENIVKNLYTISYVDKLKDGSYVVFGEIFYYWVEVVTSRDSRGNTTTRYIYHYDYGPAGMVKIDSTGTINSSTVVEYKLYYVNYNPGFGGLPMAIGKNGYMVVTTGGYSVIDFGKPNNTLKNFTSINNGGRSGRTEIIRADNNVLMISSKNKSVVFSTLTSNDRSSSGSDKRKKKKK